MKVYLASPLGFAESTRDYLEKVVEALARHVEVSNPWDDHRFDKDFDGAVSLDSRSEARALLGEINRELGRSNEQRIRESDGVVAVLDGVDVDSGTASEIGFAYGIGKRCYGLRTDFRLAGDNEGSIVNLQVQYFIEASGGSVHTSIDSLLPEIERWTGGA
jgi:nucleoside 2-deoxyribosyltransferase